MATFQLSQQVDGIEQLARRLVGYKRGIRNKILRKAFREGAQPPKTFLKQNAPEDTKAYKKALFIKIGTSRRAGNTYAVIGPKTKVTVVDASGNKRRPSKYAHLIEGGRKANQARFSRVLTDGKKFFGKRVRAVPGKHIVEKAIKRTGKKSVAIIESVVHSEIDKL
jgi:hypothetical protein